ncbi:AI-2E family transporter [Kaistia dalseonensis]|uniref:PurR-regulated permease PerM n=1 Tax=Kaistia dalseonensis TaxID=410840 RepID=A0ABU0H0H7_9HYPH|nr:AI-2E family transporter [Kaistia dalseonensis]MCX5493258.1 AI-2E family transporter [Kaistia dalseonensis]MDQ0435815.1 putative PurR-regulated permease PerM [Kaistia dalseonensis]
MSLQRHIGFWLGTLAIFLLFLFVFRGVLLPFIAGMAVAYGLDPVADWFERRGLSRLAASLVILVIFIVFLVLLFVLFVPILANQLAGFIERIPSYAQQLQGLATNLLDTRLGQLVRIDPDQLKSSMGQFMTQGASWLTSLLQSIWSGGSALIDVMSLLVVTPVVAFYLLVDWDRMIARIDSWLPRDSLEDVRQIARDVDTAVAGFVRGQGLLCIILGTFYAVALAAIGLNFGLLIGFGAGMLSFIPYVGSTLGFVVSVGVAVVQFWPEWPWVAVVVAIFAIGQFFEGNILQPRLVGRSVGLHPVWLMFGLFAFGVLFGFVGLLIAVPATAAIAVLMRFALARYLTSPIYRGDGIVDDEE